MKRSSTIFLQVVIVLIGIGVLAAMLWVPTQEGRNADATLSATYFRDPFLVYVYIASVPFFVALYQAFRLLGSAGRDDVFRQRSVGALRTIKRCALATAGLIVGALAYIIIALGGKDDIAGAIMMGIVATFTCVVIATAAAVFERVLQNALDMKSENDLTV